MASEGAPPIATFSIGWIAALSHELTAARLMLDKEYRDAPEDFDPSSSDTNTYTFGRIGRHHVVIAVLGAGDYGLVSAAETASRLSASMPHIRIGLMVGIGAGVGTKRKVRLGDIAVSEPTGTHGGLVQYDLFKAAVESGNPHDQRTGFLNRPPRALLTALQKLKSSHDMDESSIEEYIDQAFQRRPKLKKSFGFPGREQDPHASAKRGSEGDSDSPDVHYGIIASGNVLVKSSRKRDHVLDWLAKENIHPICFEMEAAGLMNTFPCLVIRGICDYADELKNDVWQKYAALVAAAYAKDLLGHVDKREIDTGPPLAQLLNDMQALHEDVSEVKAETVSMKKKLSADEFAKLLNWLCPSDFSLQYTKKRSERLQGTGTWFLEDERYKNWSEQDDSHTLYCEGAPGAGKSMLAAFVAEILLDTVQKEKTAVLLLFCDYARKEEQSKANFVSTILRQLLYRHGQDSDLAAQLTISYGTLEQTSDFARPVAEKLEDILSRALKPYDSIHLVMDALDECDYAICRDFISLLRSLVSGKVFKILATSRHNPNIQGLFPGAASLPIKADVSDIELYVRERAKELELRIPDRPDLINEVVRSVVRSVDGVFLLGQLHMNNLVQHDTPNDVRAALDLISSGSDAYQQAYKNTLERITSRPKKLTERALSILIWVTYAKQPLTPEELQHALATKLGQKHLDPDDIPGETALLSVCEGLIVVSSSESASWSKNRQTLEVRLVHFTAEQYLRDVGDTWFTAAHLQDPHLTLATTCFTYLAFDKISKWPRKVDSLALKEYASSHAGLHAHDAEASRSDGKHDGEALEDAVLPFLRQSESIDSGYAIRYLADYDLTYLFSVLWKNFPQLDLPDRDNAYTPLMYAASNGSSAMVSALLDTGKVDINHVDLDEQNALSVAVIEGHEDVVRLLVDTRKVDIADIQRPRQGRTVRSGSSSVRSSPLSQAINAGRSEITKHLLRSAKLNCNDTDSSLRTPLHLAATGGHTGIAKLLVRSKRVSNLDAVDQYGRTPLYLAARKGHKPIVKLLTQTGKTRLDYHSQKRDTPLSAAARGLHESICQVIYHQLPQGQHRSKAMEHAFLHCFLWQYHEIWPTVNDALLILERIEPSLVAYRTDLVATLDPFLATQRSVMARYWFGVLCCNICDVKSLHRGLYCPTCLKGKDASFNICHACVDAGHWCYSSEHVLEEYDGQSDLQALVVVNKRTIKALELGDALLAAVLERYRTNHAICQQCAAVSILQGFHCGMCGAHLCVSCVDDGHWCKNVEHDMREINMAKCMRGDIPIRSRYVKPGTLPLVAHVTLDYVARDIPCDVCKKFTDHGFHCAKCPSTAEGLPAFFNADICFRCVQNGHWCRNKKHWLREYNASTSYDESSSWRSFTEAHRRRKSLSGIHPTRPTPETTLLARRHSTTNIGEVDWQAWPRKNTRWPGTAGIPKTYPRPRRPTVHRQVRDLYSVAPDARRFSNKGYFMCPVCGLYRAAADQAPYMARSTCLYCGLDIGGCNNDVEMKWCVRGHHAAPRNDFLKVSSDGVIGKERQTYCGRHRFLPHRTPRARTDQKVHGSDGEQGSSDEDSHESEIEVTRYRHLPWKTRYEQARERISTALARRQIQGAGGVSRGGGRDINYTKVSVYEQKPGVTRVHVEASERRYPAPVITIYGASEDSTPAQTESTGAARNVSDDWGSTWDASTKKKSQDYDEPPPPLKQSQFEGEGVAAYDDWDLWRWGTSKKEVETSAAEDSWGAFTTTKEKKKQPDPSMEAEQATKIETVVDDEWDSWGWETSKKDKKKAKQAEPSQGTAHDGEASPAEDPWASFTTMTKKKKKKKKKTKKADTSRAPVPEPSEPAAQDDESDHWGSSTSKTLLKEKDADDTQEAQTTAKDEGVEEEDLWGGWGSGKKKKKKRKTVVWDEDSAEEQPEREGG